MSFGKEIYTLLLQHDIVIIPGLGAFVSEYQPAEISDESDEIKPPSKTISFNTQLKNNDGLLVGHIAEKLHISHFNALVRIEKERDEMLFKLDKGDEVFVEGVGTLSYNEQGEIVFEASEEENMLLDSFGLGAMSISEPEPVETPKNETAETPEEEKAVEKEEPEITKAEPQEEENLTEKAPTGEPEIKEAKQEVQTKEEEEEEEEEEEAKKRKPWLFLLIIIPLLAVAVFVFLKGSNNTKGDEEKMLPPTYTTEESTAAMETAVVDTVATDTLSIAEEETALAADTTQNIPEAVKMMPEEQDSIKYYLVGGSFSIKENADNYLTELQQKGYEAFHVGKKGRFFIVGIAGYKTFREADTAKSKYMEDNPGSEVWVYKK
nr:SPOR domain-containing protein [uncultured Draconibacterium sp.]